MQSEDGDAGGHKSNDKVFVQRVTFAEDGEVQEHYREELAGFGEDEGNVVDVRKGGIAKGGGERGCY